MTLKLEMERSLIIFEKSTVSLICFALSENIFQCLVFGACWIDYEIVPEILWYHVVLMMTNAKPNMKRLLIRFKNIHDLSYLFCFTRKHFPNWDFFSSWTECEFVLEIQWYCIGLMMMTLKLEMERSLIIF